MKKSKSLLPWQHHVRCVAEIVQKLSVVGFFLSHGYHTVHEISAISPFLWIHSTVNEILILSKWHPILGFLRIGAPDEHLWLNSYHTDMRSVRKDVFCWHIGQLSHAFHIHTHHDPSVLLSQMMNRCRRSEGRERTSLCSNLKSSWFGTASVQRDWQRDRTSGLIISYVRACLLVSFPCLKASSGVERPCMQKTKQKEEEKNTVKKS